jgi:hypothetical protein
MEHHQQAMPAQGGQFYAQPEKYAGQHAGYAPSDAQYYQQQYHGPSGAAAAQYPHTAQYTHNGAGHPAAAPSSTVFGMARGVFFAVIAIVIVLLALVIGLGAGLGVSHHNLQDAQTSLAAAQSNAYVAHWKPSWPTVY